jgi:hypothetical protein
MKEINEVILAKEKKELVKDTDKMKSVDKIR